MNQKDEKRMAAHLAKIMAMLCVRNTKLEEFHSGRVPISKTGDYSDVMVVDAEGNKIPWSEVSRCDDNEMRELMQQVVNRLYTFHLKGDDPALRRKIERWMQVAQRWDEPEVDEFYLENKMSGLE